MPSVIFSSITVQLPGTQEKIILKLADPQVGKALFSLAETQQDTELFGPFSHIYTTDIIDNELNHYQRPNSNILPLRNPYTLSETQNNALDAIEHKRNRYNLYQHMQTYFPEYLANYPEADKKQAIYQLIEEANALGYLSEMEQAYYLNLYGYLGDNVLKNYPEIDKLVQKKDLDAIREASQLAGQVTKQGTN